MEGKVWEEVCEVSYWYNDCWYYSLVVDAWGPFSDVCRVVWFFMK